LRLQQLTIPAASAKPAAAGPTSGVLLVKNMTVFLTFCSLHISGISAWLVYRSWHPVCQATLPNFLAVFCDKFLPQLPGFAGRARCVDCINPHFEIRNGRLLGDCEFAGLECQLQAPGARTAAICHTPCDKMSQGVWEFAN
jgi:hypothetical protein